MVLEQNARIAVQKANANGVIDVFAQEAYDEAVSHGWKDEPEVIKLRNMLQSKQQ